MEIKELLHTEEFKRVDVGRYIDEYFEGLFDYNVIDLFDTLKKEFGRIPSQQEYIERGLMRAEGFFKGQPTRWCGYNLGRHTFTWDEDLIRAVKGRLDNAYNSYVVEEQVEEFIRDNYDVKTATKYRKYLDTNFGSDVTILSGEKIYYIHVVKESKSSRNHLKDKATRKSYIPNKFGRKCYWYRNWNKVHHGHHALFFDKENTEQTEIINGVVVFRDDYLTEYFDNLFSGDKYDVMGESELEEFYKFLRKSKLA